MNDGNRDSGNLIAFDRQRAHRDRRADEPDGLEPHSLPPQRLRDIRADGRQVDELWSRVEHEFKSPDWSLGTCDGLSNPLRRPGVQQHNSVE